MYFRVANFSITFPKAMLQMHTFAEATHKYAWHRCRQQGERQRTAQGHTTLANIHQPSVWLGPFAIWDCLSGSSQGISAMQKERDPEGISWENMLLASALPPLPPSSRSLPKKAAYRRREGRHSGCHKTVAIAFSPGKGGLTLDNAHGVFSGVMVYDIIPSEKWLQNPCI